MDFSNHRLNKPSIIDKGNKLTKSIIDYHTDRLRTVLSDPTLDSPFVAKALQNISEAQINDIADYAVRKGTHKGKLFVSICNKVMQT